MDPLTFASLTVTSSTLITSTLILTSIITIFPILYFINFYLRCKRYQAATPWSIQEKVVLITGASSGIGEELAYEFARQGAILILCARRIDKLTNVAKLCKDKYGASVKITKTDVTHEADIIRLIETINSTYNKIDCLVLNAGVSMGESLEEIENFNIIKNVMDVNYIGSTMMTYHSIPLKKSEKSRIIVISSLVGIVPTIPLRTGYIASKFAVRGFFESLQSELIDYNIFITIAYPGTVDTEISKSRLGKNPKPISLDDSIMSAEKCAKTIVDGSINGHKEVILTNYGRIGRIIEGIFPELLFYLTYYKSKNFYNNKDGKDGKDSKEGEDSKEGKDSKESKEEKEEKVQ